MQQVELIYQYKKIYRKSNNDLFCIRQQGLSIECHKHCYLMSAIEILINQMLEILKYL